MDGFGIQAHVIGLMLRDFQTAGGLAPQEPTGDWGRPRETGGTRDAGRAEGVPGRCLSPMPWPWPTGGPPPSLRIETRCPQAPGPLQPQRLSRFRRGAAGCRPRLWCSPPILLLPLLRRSIEGLPRRWWGRTGGCASRRAGGRRCTWRSRGRRRCSPGLWPESGPPEAGSQHRIQCCQA